MEMGGKKAEEKSWKKILKFLQRASNFRILSSAISAPNLFFFPFPITLVSLQFHTYFLSSLILKSMARGTFQSHSLSSSASVSDVVTSQDFAMMTEPSPLPSRLQFSPPLLDSQLKDRAVIETCQGFTLTMLLA